MILSWILILIGAIVGNLMWWLQRRENTRLMVAYKAIYHQLAATQGKEQMWKISYYQNLPGEHDSRELEPDEDDIVPFDENGNLIWRAK